MAQSRLERIGTIYTRVGSLIKGGAVKQEDKPLWYSIYEAFPPKFEPRYDRVAPNIEVRDIFYKEDVIRAKFQKDHGSKFMSNLVKQGSTSHTEKFLSMYQSLQKSGIPEPEVYETAVKKYMENNLQSQLSQSRNIQSQTRSQPRSIKIESNLLGILKD